MAVDAQLKIVDAGVTRNFTLADLQSINDALEAITDKTPLKILDGTVAWTAAQAAGTAKTIAVTTAIPADFHIGGLVRVFVKNPSTATELTVQPQEAWTPSGVGAEYADIATAGGRATFTALQNSSLAFLLERPWAPGTVGQLKLTNNAAADAGGFTARVQAWALARS